MEKDLLIFIENQLFIFILVILILERIKRKASTNLLSCWILNITGTILHEVSHFAIAFLLNGKPSSLSIIPIEKEIKGIKYYELGNVSVSNLRWYNEFFIGMSPLLLWVCIYYFNQYYFSYFEDTLLNNFVFIFLLIVLIDSSIPSITDLKIAFKRYYLITITLCSITTYFLYLKGIIHV